MNYRIISSMLLLAFVALSTPLRGAPDTNAPAGKSSEKDTKKEGSDKKEDSDKLSETTNTVNINGVEIQYRATAGTLIVKNEEDKPQVSFFFVAYTRLDTTNNPGARPIAFSFNGGPGSSSVWLHMGLLGPRRVSLKEDGTLPPPPFQFVNNNESLLDESDLVFIDPVSTGFTRAVPLDDAHKYHGVDQDLASVGDFIRLYATRYDRWLSPKFLIGESYGTTRAAGLSSYLENRFGMYLNGIVLVSAVLDFSTISFDAGNDLPFILFLPSETATAWYHKKLPPDLQGDFKKAQAESENFALGDFSQALLQGGNLQGAARSAIVKRTARLTGLSEDFVDRANLRVHADQFFKELLRKERLTVGRYDSRITGVDLNSVGASPDYDPSYTAVLGPFTAAFNDYVRRDLKFESDLPYEVLTGKVEPWDFSRVENQYLDIAENLRRAMTHNPYLKVFVANGYYDLATPYLATRYTFDHVGLPADLRANVSMGYYEAGHMMYINAPSRTALKKDIATFIHSALPPK
jgi:carboxypeptidase C (cathepsin A)